MILPDLGPVHSGKLRGFRFMKHNRPFVSGFPNYTMAECRLFISSQVGHPYHSDQSNQMHQVVSTKLAHNVSSVILNSPS